jgi:hypothetical protein
MIEQGKGRFVENLRIIQLSEADLNFVLHIIWGHCLIRHAISRGALDNAQYALLGQTCNNTVLNKNLFLDLSRQTMTPGILTNYDAAAAFNRILAGLASITCHQVGLPHIAGNVMFQLLKQMSFHLVTGFSQLDDCFKNDQDGITGQGVLARCSSGVAAWHVPFTF